MKASDFSKNFHLTFVILAVFNMVDISRPKALQLLNTCVVFCCKHKRRVYNSIIFGRIDNARPTHGLIGITVTHPINNIGSSLKNVLVVFTIFTACIRGDP